MNECITFKKKPQKLQILQHFFGIQLARAAPVLEAGGKPSTMFPPEGLVELTSRARNMKSLSDNSMMKNSKFSKIFKNVIFLKFHRKLPVTFNLTLIEQIDK